MCLPAAFCTFIVTALRYDSALGRYRKAAFPSRPFSFVVLRALAVKVFLNPPDGS
jgi:hypothetical protein